MRRGVSPDEFTLMSCPAICSDDERQNLSDLNPLKQRSPPLEKTHPRLIMKRSHIFLSTGMFPSHHHLSRSLSSDLPSIGCKTGLDFFLWRLSWSFYYLIYVVKQWFILVWWWKQEERCQNHLQLCSSSVWRFCVVHESTDRDRDNLFYFEVSPAFCGLSHR